MVFLTLWFCWKRDGTQTKWISCPSSLLYLHVRSNTNLLEANSYFSSFSPPPNSGRVTTPFIWPEKPLPCIDDDLQSLATWLLWPRYLMRGLGSKNIFVNRAECEGNRIRILMKWFPCHPSLFKIILLLGVVSVLLKMKKYQNRIKLIHIDPPRNSKASQDGNLSTG